MLLIFPGLSKIDCIGSQDPHLGLVFLITESNIFWVNELEPKDRITEKSTGLQDKGTPLRLKNVCVLNRSFGFPFNRKASTPPTLKSEISFKIHRGNLFF